MAFNFFIFRQSIVNSLFQQRSNLVSKASSGYFGTNGRDNCLFYTKLCRFISFEADDSIKTDYYKQHNITIKGKNVPEPITDIYKCNFPDYIMKFLKQQEFVEPTVIQAVAWPVVMSGQNFVGIARTGSGKTLAYLLPAIIELKEKQGRKGKGPRVLILVPTRELALQIESVVKGLQRILNFRFLCIYGGVKKCEQIQSLNAGVDLLIATPGRLNDYIISKTTNLYRCSYIVLDEGDQMLEMGFEEQIRQAFKDLPFEKQMLMFSATWPKEIQLLSKDFLGEYVRVYVGSKKLAANPNITQCVYVCNRNKKMEIFKSIIESISSNEFGKVLIFVNTISYLDTILATVKRFGLSAETIHGDKSQKQREDIVNQFKNGTYRILIATDVAARGLDISGISHVINYDFLDLKTYVHRIGRTARHENNGESHTLFTEDNASYTLSLIELLEQAKQEVPESLHKLAKDYIESQVQQKNTQAVIKQSKNENKFGNPIKRWSKYRSNKKGAKIIHNH